MNKRTRLVILLAVLAICFVFLWPSISWYARTPKEVQALALGSTENIKDYATVQAAEDVRTFKALVASDANAELPAEYSWVAKEAAKEYKLMGTKAPAKMTVKDVVTAYSSEAEFMEIFRARYRDRILKAKKRYQNSVKLGLDLSGGMNVIVRADLDAALASQGDAVASENAEAFKKEAMANALENLTSRIDRFGLTSPVVRQQGDDRIYIEIPGAAQADAINTLIMGKGVLNFRLADMDATNSFRTYYNAHPATTFNAAGELMDKSIIPEDCEVMGYYTKDEYGLDERIDWLVVKKEIALDGQHVKSADVRNDEFSSQLQVCFTLDTDGAAIFADFTGKHVGEYMAIVSDNKVKSNAVIRDAITGGQVALTGAFSVDEANNIKKVLQTAWLNVPLSVESQQVIGASLGDQAIHQGIMAIILGLSLILVFMLIFYKASGINAVVAQILNLYIMFSVLSAFNLTLTLSSIAGMILTIGMAVDANVIVFERIKEELRAGKTRKAAISMGFDNAFWAIMDSNITTFIAAIFLSQLGTGSIQGFAVSLAIGVCSSVFTALFVSRLMFDFDTDVLKTKKVSIGWGIKPTEGAEKKKTANFGKGFIPAVVISSVVAVAGIAGFFAKGINFGIDFKPGLIEEIRISAPAAEMTYSGPAKVTVDVSASLMEVVVSGNGAENATYSFDLNKYQTIGELASAVSEIEDVTMTVRNGSASSYNAYLNSSKTNILSANPLFIYPAGASDASADDVREALSAVSGISVKQLGSGNNESFQIRMGIDGDSTQSELQSVVEDTLYDDFGKENVAVIKTDFIGSSFSKSIAGKAVLMLVLTVLLIWVYAAIRFHWDFALGSVIALIHDTLIMMTFIIWTQMEFSTTVLAAVLTIIGYSINATVVILDRIRYNLKMMDNVSSFKDILNKSLSDTLIRSILTTVTTLFAVMALFIFTTGSIKDFSLALIVGLISGMYSSIFISSAFIMACRKNWKPEFGVHHSLKRAQAAAQADAE